MAAPLSRRRRARSQRADLLADGAHGFLGGREPGLEPDRVAVGLHVLRSGAALGRRDAAPRSPARARVRVARRTPWRAATDRHVGVPARVSAGRRGAAINRGLVVVALLLAFGVEPGDLHCDLRPAGARRRATDARRGRRRQRAAGRRRRTQPRPPASPACRESDAVSAVDHSYAYVGPDLQDTFGIDAATIGAATRLRDSYFLGGSARELLRRLRATPDGILVSLETITDYSLHRGDLLRLRVLDRASGRFRVVPFHVVGTVQEFPSAPKDSFMVANLSYLERAAHDGGPNVVFASTSGDPASVARRIAAATRADGTAVRNIREQTQQTVSSITTVDLTGIARIESVFVVVLAAGAMALFVGLGLAERRQRVRDDGRARRLAAGDRGVSLVRGRARARRQRSRSRPGSAGCSPRCSSRCCSTCSTHRPTRSRFPGRSSAAARRRGDLWRLCVAAAARRSRASAGCRSARYSGNSERNRGARDRARGRRRAPDAADARPAGGGLRGDDRADRPPSCCGASPS